MIPTVLASPPWLQPRPKRKARMLAALPYAERVVTTRGVHAYRESEREEHCRGELAAARRGERRAFVSVLHALPDEEALATWNASEASWFHGGDYDAREVMAHMERLGVPAIEGLLRYARGKLPSAVLGLSRVESPRVAPDLALVLAKGKKAALAEKWFLTYPEAACVGLIPAALGADRTLASASGHALRYLADTGHLETIQASALRWGEDIAREVREVLEDDQPARVPTLPAFVQLDALTLTADGEALPRSARENLALMLRFTNVIPAYSGLRAVRAACDRASLREFAWGLFSQWLEADADPAHDWAITALGHLGDDALVARAIPLLRTWQFVRVASRSTKLLHAIALVGTDLAFAHLDHVARKGSAPLLRSNAQAAMERVAMRLRISPDELEDRRAPHLDLDARGRMAFENGWTASLDAHLKPIVFDAEGKPRKAFVKGAAAADVTRWKALQKNAKLVATSQIERFERAMTSERTWTAKAFREVILAHPLLMHLARRLVWRDADGRTFRVVEDATLADVNDAPFTLEAAHVRVAHPVELGDALMAWSRVFADYEILQPFAQLGRATHALQDDERKGTQLRRFEGKRVPWETALRLLREGFDDASSGSRIHTLRAMFANRVQLLVSLEPGLLRGDPRSNTEQRTTRVEVLGVDSLAQLSPVMASEVLAKLSGLGG
jgi:hypothetical protein